MPSPISTPDATARPPRRRWVAPVLCSLIAALIYAFVTGRLVVPERFNPWAPLNVMAPPDWLTGYKLAHARSDPARCLNALAQTGMAYDLLPDRITGPACGFENAVRLRSAGVRLGGPVALSCPVALSFFMWETHALQPAAQRHLQQRVTAIDHLGSYACRNVNRGEGAAPGNAAALAGSRSRHATANALDIAGFTLENGKRITVLNHWRQNPQQETARSGSEALFLSSAHDGACRFFDGVLGPGYNAVHRDHFHLETGGYRMCR